MKAVILAAGMGTRLRPMTEKLPKGLVKIEGKSLLEYSLEALKANGINNIMIVTGFYGESIKKELDNKHKDMIIEYVENKEYATTGSMYSFSKLKNILNEDILLLESDLIYDKNAIKTILESKEKDVILIAKLLNSGDDVYICADEENKLTCLGKKITEEEKKHAKGALVGISKLSKEFLTELFKEADQNYSDGEKDYHYEECIFETSKIRTPVYVELCKDLNWIEVDNESDLKRAKKEIYPKIRGNKNETR
jgi:choline kinase